MARAHFVQKARKDVPGTDIKAGESYWWWKFRRGGKRFSKIKPKRSRLTQSEFFGRIYDLEDDVIATAKADESLRETRDDVVSQLEEIRDECQEKLDNMPESLQQGPTGELLQSRIDAMEDAINDFEAIDMEDPDEGDIDIDHEREEDESDQDYEDRIQSETEEKTEQYWQDKLEEFQSVTIEAP